MFEDIMSYDFPDPPIVIDDDEEEDTIEKAVKKFVFEKKGVWWHTHKPTRVSSFWKWIEL